MMLEQEAGKSMAGDRRSPLQRGFTLVELMTVVVLVTVLALLAVYGVRKYVLTAKSSEAYTMINAIKAAQEAYKDETFTYLNVSGVYGSLYPAEPGRKKTHWNYPGHPDYARWQTLGVDSQTAVEFGYAVVAGPSGQAPSPPVTERTFNYPDTGEPWYVVLAVADRTGDGVKAMVVSSSHTSDVYVEKEDE